MEGRSRVREYSYQGISQLHTPFLNEKTTILRRKPVWKEDVGGRAHKQEAGLLQESWRPSVCLRSEIVN